MCVKPGGGGCFGGRGCRVFEGFGSVSEAFSVGFLHVSQVSQMLASSSGSGGSHCLFVGGGGGGNDRGALMGGTTRISRKSRSGRDKVGSFLGGHERKLRGFGLTPVYGSYH